MGFRVRHGIPCYAGSGPRAGGGGVSRGSYGVSSNTHVENCQVCRSGQGSPPDPEQSFSNRSLEPVATCPALAVALPAKHTALSAPVAVEIHRAPTARGEKGPCGRLKDESCKALNHASCWLKARPLLHRAYIGTGFGVQGCDNSSSLVLGSEMSGVGGLSRLHCYILQSVEQL